MYKQVIVVRSDLEMGKGKIAAQSAHASLISYEQVKRKNYKIAKAWLEEGQKKVVLKVKNEEELLLYFAATKKNGIPAEFVRDAGHTQIEPGTITCFAAGPWNEKKLDEIFGKLKLL